MDILGTIKFELNKVFQRKKGDRGRGRGGRGMEEREYGGGGVEEWEEKGV